MRSPTKCSKCSLANFPICYRGPLDAKVVLIGEAPGEEENQQGQPFVGPAGRKLVSCLEAAGWDESELLFTNACLCPIVGGHPSSKQIEACRENVIKIVKKHPRDLVILLGGPAQKSAKVGGGSLKDRGTVRDSEHYGRCFLTVHPSYVLPHHAPAMEPVLIADLRLAKNLEAALEDETNVSVVTDADEFEKMMYVLNKADEVVFDTETYPQREGGKIFALSFSTTPGNAWTLPLTRNRQRVWDESEVKRLLQKLKHFFGHELGPKLIAFHSKFDQAAVYKTFGIKIPLNRMAEDPLVLAHLVDENLAKKTQSSETVAGIGYSLTEVSRFFLQLVAWDEGVDEFFLSTRWEDILIAKDMAAQKIPNLEAWKKEFGWGKNDRPTKGRVTELRKLYEKDYTQIPYADVEYYAGRDADITGRAYRYLKDRLLKMDEGKTDHPSQMYVAREIVRPLSWMLADTERVGVQVDRQGLKEVGDEAAAVAAEAKDTLQGLAEDTFDQLDEPSVLAEISDEALAIYGTTMAKFKKMKDPRVVTDFEGTHILIDGQLLKTFNPASAQQVQRLLFDIWKSTYNQHLVSEKTGRPSTGEEALEWILEQQEGYPEDIKDQRVITFCETMLHWRSADTTRKLFTEKYAQLMDENAVVHPTFHLIGTETGRLSCSGPNLQQADKRFRDRLFVARPGKILVGYDLAQAEVRMLAALSGDQALKEALQAGDIYVAIGTRVLHKHANEIDKELRDKLKILVLAGQYGGGPTMLSQSIGISVDEAEAYLDGFWNAFADAADWKRDMEIQAQNPPHEIFTYHGRRRRLWLADCPDDMLRFEALRNAVNSPVQGSSNDLNSQIAGDCYHAMDSDFGDTLLWNIIHDATIYEIPKASEKAGLKIMETVGPRELNGVHFPVETWSGERWIK